MMFQGITVVRKLSLPLPKDKITTVMYRFNRENPTSCQVDINGLDGQTVMIKGRQEEIDQGWGVLVKIAAAEPEAPGNVSDEPIQQWTWRPEATYRRPSEVFQGDTVRRFADGRLFLSGSGVLLVDALDRIVRQFGRQEGAQPFFAEPVWRGEELHKFGYVENSVDLCRIDHFDHGQHHYWQNAACDNIWKSLTGKSINGLEIFTTMGTCCRNERRQYYFLERLKTFRMREIVAVGTPTEILSFRERALSFVERLNQDLQLNARLETANDPFFIQDDASIEATLQKYDLPELVKIEYRPDLYDGKSLACASFNVHGDFFSRNLGFQGGKLWTSCAAFGLERLAWAVLIQHGPLAAGWPPALRDAIDEINVERYR